MSVQEKALIVILRSCAIVLLTAFPMMLLPVDWMAATHRTCGSISATSPAERRFRPCRPFCRPRSSMVSRCGSSDSSTATTSLPQISCGKSWRRQKRISSRRPSAQVRAFSEPGG